MKIFDQIAMCLQNLSRRKVRTALTTMGVVIGTCLFTRLTAAAPKSCTASPPISLG